MKTKKETKEYQRKWKREHKKEGNKYTKKYRGKNPLKFKKIWAVKNSTKNIIIDLWKEIKGCCICNTKKNLIIHHWKYRLPIQKQDFSVVCKKCHKNIHSVGYQTNLKKINK